MSLDCKKTLFERADVLANPNQICPKNPYRIYELERIENGLKDVFLPMMSAQMGICAAQPLIMSTTGSNMTPFTIGEYNINCYKLQTLASPCTIGGGVTKVWDSATGTEKLFYDGGNLVIPANTIIYAQFTHIYFFAGATLLAYKDPFR